MSEEINLYKGSIVQNNPNHNQRKRKVRNMAAFGVAESYFLDFTLGNHPVTAYIIRDPTEMSWEPLLCSNSPFMQKYIRQIDKPPLHVHTHSHIHS